MKLLQPIVTFDVTKSLLLIPFPLYCRKLASQFLTVVMTFLLLTFSFSINASKPDVVYHPVMDPKSNMVMLHIPLPKKWKIVKKTSPEDPGIIGPNGIKVLEFQSQSFTYTNDPFMQQAYMASGVQMRPPPVEDNN